PLAPRAEHVIGQQGDDGRHVLAPRIPEDHHQPDRTQMRRIGRRGGPLPYSRNVSADVWIGAVTTLGGGLLGGAISVVLGRQQAREARLQRQEADARELLRRSADRRFQAYADFLTGARSFRNAVEAYYLHPRHKPSLTALDALLQTANDASALVFL